MFKIMTQRSGLKNLKTFFHEVTVTGFVYNPIIFLSLDVLSSPSTWSWSSRKRMQKPGIACCRINALMHTLMHLSLWYFRFIWQTGVLQYTDMVANTDMLFLDRELNTQVNTVLMCTLYIMYATWWKWFYRMNPCLYDQQCRCREC